MIRQRMSLTVALNCLSNSDANITSWKTFLKKLTKTKANMKRPNSNYIANVSVLKALQYPSNQKPTQDKLRPENISFLDSFGPVYYYSRLFGLMPFTIDCDASRGVQKPRIDIFDGIWFSLSILIYISMAIIAYNDMKLPQDSDTASFILILGDYVLLILGLIYSALIIVFDMYNRFRLCELLNKFITFDKEVNFRNSIQFLTPNFYLMLIGISLGNPI